MIWVKDDCDETIRLWLPAVICPNCGQAINLVDNWTCPARCKVVRPRHAFSPCTVCGTRNIAIECECKYRLIFIHRAASREPIYSTVHNRTRLFAVGAASAFAVLFLLSAAQNALDGVLAFAVLAGTATLFAIAVPPPKFKIQSSPRKTKQGE